jgi:hypothetical protein
MTQPNRALVLAIAVSLWAAPAVASPILEVELNNTLVAAQLIPGAAFTLPVPATVFNSPGYATATVTGAGGGNDVDFYSFVATGGSVYFDIDNDPFGFDTILSLFDSAGTLIAYDDDSFPADPGSISALDSFLGLLTLPGPGTYYIAVTQFANFANSRSTGVLTALVRPDGGPGGSSVSGATPGDSSFGANDAIGSVPYTLHISVQNPAGAAVPVPDPATLVLLGSGLAAAAVRRRPPP